MPGQAPAEAAVISQPIDGQHFSVSQITVKGTCPSGAAYVQIFRNDVFGGTARCVNGEFSLVITLMPGANRLVARVFSADNQAGPDSAAITVFYDVPVVSAAATIEPLLVLVAPIYPGGYVNKKLELELEILGGEGPYAVSIDWGDGSNDLLVRQIVGKFTVSHIYTEAGTYEIRISVSDVADRKASIQTVAIISGEPVKIEQPDLIEKHSQSVWVRIVGPILLIVVLYIAGLLTGLKIVGDDLKSDHRQ